MFNIILYTYYFLYTIIHIIACICFQIFDVCLTLVFSMLITISFVELLRRYINWCITFLKTDIHDYFIKHTTCRKG